MSRLQVLKHLPGAREGKRRGGNGDVRIGATARGAMKKSWRVRAMERKEARGDDSVAYLLPTGSEVPFESHRG